MSDCLRSADASLDASIGEYDAILISLIAEVVTAYIDVRTFEQRLKYARHNVKVQESSLELSTTRYDDSKTTKVGVYLADANLNATEATIPSLETGLRQANIRLCTLLGISTVDLSAMLGNGDGISQVPAEIAVGIPAELLRRRPDVRQAERQVAAQSAQDQLAETQGRVVVNMIAVYRPLGGGWQIRCSRFQPQMLPLVNLPPLLPGEPISVPEGKSIDIEKRRTKPTACAWRWAERGDK